MNLLRKIRTSFFLWMANLPMSGRTRPVFLRLAGIKVGNNCFIGRGVVFDSLCPERIHIGDHVHLTVGCTLIAHYLDTASPGIVWKFGDIDIENDVFVGAGTIFAKPCKVGAGRIIGCGSVITKDIPEKQVWAGNPARFVKDRLD